MSTCWHWTSYAVIHLNCIWDLWGSSSRLGINYNDQVIFIFFFSSWRWMPVYYPVHWNVSWPLSLQPFLVSSTKMRNQRQISRSLVLCYLFFVSSRFSPLQSALPSSASYIPCNLSPTFNPSAFSFSWNCSFSAIPTFSSCAYCMQMPFMSIRVCSIFGELQI
jgi:hypothetical protein